MFFIDAEKDNVGYEIVFNFLYPETSNSFCVLIISKSVSISVIRKQSSVYSSSRKNKESLSKLSGEKLLLRLTSSAIILILS